MNRIESMPVDESSTALSTLGLSGSIRSNTKIRGTARVIDLLQDLSPCLAAWDWLVFDGLTTLRTAPSNADHRLHRIAQPLGVAPVVVIGSPSARLQRVGGDGGVRLRSWRDSVQFLPFADAPRTTG
jgi:hypothetical protein